MVLIDKREPHKESIENAKFILDDKNEVIYLTFIFPLIFGV